MPNTKSSGRNAKKQPKEKTKKSTKNYPKSLELFIDEIKDIYWAENHLVKSLPKMINSASSAELAAAITEHLAVTRTHVTRLEQVFEMLEQQPQAKKCDGMEGLTKEGESVIEDTDAGTLSRDIGIILSSQKVEHYEIAAYTGLSRLAITLGLNEIAALLEETLAEEIASDETLSNIAERSAV